MIKQKPTARCNIGASQTKNPACSIRRGHDEDSVINDNKDGAGDGSRTRDPKLGKLVLYQLSYARFLKVIITAGIYVVNPEKQTGQIPNLPPLEKKLSRGVYFSSKYLNCKFSGRIKGRT